MSSDKKRPRPQAPSDPPRSTRGQRPGSLLRDALYVVIFEADTPAGKAFDAALLVMILLSVLAVMLESVGAIRGEYGPWLLAAEWCFTLLFTIEYLFRLYSTRRPMRYARSFLGVIDLLAVLPTYLSLLAAGTQALLVIRVIRLLRVFRVFKLTRYMGEARLLTTALRSSRHKIVVFVLAVLTVVVIVGSLMYLIEGPARGFTSIPRSVYWAIVTMTTVGYGDIAPRTVPGQTLAALVMILGYGIIAVPTGIFSVELFNARRSGRTCTECGLDSHDIDARFCKRCGHKLDKSPS
ncbi:MAG: ion transporter [Candidatus Alcyoniella australis]|nr:ion transporter [Candidatus Alcyoniella australis]